ncbi:MAG TPA: hypothetical protein VHU90_13050 [Galbitalea sp.]|jgi:alkylhydroperoxidase/carboxymuconolactone decarboxylase family protein YurZ|nr:hypothetical protein [Galbitalea sp.]HEX3899045.1 hypothetical protein [Mycobacteriales bacterium]
MTDRAEQPAVSAEVLPGLPLRTSADTDGDVSRVLSKLERGGLDLRILRTIANSPNCFRPFILMSDALNNRAVLPARCRELAILWLAARDRVGYEWEEHISMSSNAGVTEEERDALAGSRDPVESMDSLSDADRVVLRAVKDLADSGRMDVATWNSLSELWGVAGALDVLFVFCWWGKFVPAAIRAIGLEPSAPVW